MPSSIIEIESELKKLGLSNNEIVIYLFLIKRKKSSIQIVSRKNNIPRSSVYESLKDLLDKGLIEEVIEDKKKEYKAYPLKILKNNLLEEQARLQENIDNIDILEETVKNLEVYSNADIDDFEIRKYSGKSGARQLFWNTLSAKDTILVYSFFGRSKYVGKEFYENFVKESKKRGIEEKVIINPSERAFELIKRHTNTSLARTNPKDIKVINTNQINIKGETFIYDNIFATVYLDKEDIVGFEVESKSFVETHKSMFNLHWSHAKELDI